MHDSECQVCNTDTPYPSVSHESVPSLIDNLVFALYGQINKNVTGGRVIWDIPCDPVTAPATVFGVARNNGEGLLCYFIRAFNAAYIGGGTYYGTFIGPLTGNASTATNLLRGQINSIPYQSAINTTSFLNAGANGQVLGILAGALQWVSAPAAVTASAIAGGAAGQVHWQSDLNTTSFTDAGTTGQVLSSNGTSAPTWITQTFANTPSTIVARDASGTINAGGLLVNNPSGASSISTAPSQPLAIDATSAVLSLNVSGGNVGIGTASPVVTLDVNKAGGQLRVSDGSVDMRIQPLRVSSVGLIGTISAHDVVLVANNSEKLRIAQSGNVGIGILTPTTKLQVDGEVSATRIIASGAGAVGTNVAIGQAALQSNTTGSRNTAVGQGSLNVVTTESRNTAVGTQALQFTTGASNTAIGASALTAHTSGVGNIAIGASTGSAIITGNNNTIIGTSITGTDAMSNTLILGAGGVERIRVDSNGTIDVKGGAIINSNTTVKAWVRFNGATIGVWAGGASSVTRIVGSTTATITTTSPHRLTSGNAVYALTGVVAGQYFVTVTTANSFTITTVATTALTGIAITFQVFTITSQYNVSSIAKYGTGNYGVNFATPMATTTYAMVASSTYMLTPTGSSNMGLSIQSSHQATCQVFHTYTTAGLYDCEIGNLAFFE